MTVFWKNKYILEHDYPMPRKLKKMSIFAGPLGGPVGGAIGAGIGLFSGLLKSILKKNGCSEPSPTQILNSVKNIKSGLTFLTKDVNKIEESLDIFSYENAFDHHETQSLIRNSAERNQINFDISNNLINLNSFENKQEFAVTQGMIEQGAKQNIISFAMTQALVNQGRLENNINFQETQNIINTWRLENLAGFKNTQGLIQEGGHENLVNFAIVQGLVNVGRTENHMSFGITQGLINKIKGMQENTINFQVTRNLINLGRDENLENFKITQDLIALGRQENLINFAINQDLINQGRWENLINFQALRGTIQNLGQETIKGFSILSQQSNRNVDAIIKGRIESANNFKITFALLDRNIKATNTGRLENFKNFQTTQNFIAQVNDNLLRANYKSHVERLLYFTSTANFINQTGNRIEKTVIDANIKILKAIDKTRVEPILSNLITFATYLEGELKAISTLEEEKLVEKLKEPHGILYYLTGSITPKEVNSLHSRLSDIINHGLAIPKGEHDEVAFIALDALIDGLQMYMYALNFILRSYHSLTKHFNVKLDIISFNQYITLSELRYSESFQSFHDGLLIDVVKVLQKCESIKFLEDDKKLALRSHLNKIDKLSTGFVAYKSYIDEIKQEPGVIMKKPIFNNNISLDLQIEHWSKAADVSYVSYAIQYRTEKAVTRISKFSKKFLLRLGQSNPHLTLPKGPQTVQERFIYRKFDNAEPEYVGSVQGSDSVIFMDLHLDLYDAAGDNNETIGLPRVNALLKLGANPFTTFVQGKNAFHHAAEENNAKILRILLLNDIHGLREYDRSGKLPIHIAAKLGNLEAIQTMVDLGADINALSTGNLNVLQVSSMFNQTKVVRFLLSQNNIQIKNKENKKFHPLHLSVLGKHFEVIDELLSHTSININLKNNEGFTAFHLAVSMGNSEMVDFLMAKPNLDLNAAAKTGLTPAHLASISGVSEIIKKLISHSKLEKYKATDNGLTMLHLAAVNNHTDIVKLILQEIPSLLNIKNKNGYSALHLAIVQKNLEVVRDLLIGNADIHSSTKDGITALHIAAATDQPEVVAMLMVLGAETNQYTSPIHPIHYAAWYGRSGVRNN